MQHLWIIIALHQTLHQGMFAIKNARLKKKSNLKIKGNNWEANLSIAFFTLFISASFFLSLSDSRVGRVEILPPPVALGLSILLLLVNLAVSLVSLIHLKDSWRVGVLEDQTTELVTTGIYRFTRNPYFVSCLLMFAAYTLMLENLILLGLAIVASTMVHLMISKEESYLSSVHGKAYKAYTAKVPRYLFF